MLANDGVINFESKLHDCMVVLDGILSAACIHFLLMYLSLSLSYGTTHSCS